MAANDKPDEQVPEEEQNTTVSESEETVDIPVRLKILLLIPSKTN